MHGLRTEGKLVGHPRKDKDGVCHPASRKTERKAAIVRRHPAPGLFPDLSDSTVTCRLPRVHLAHGKPPTLSPHRSDQQHVSLLRIDQQPTRSGQSTVVLPEAMDDPLDLRDVPPQVTGHAAHKLIKIGAAAVSGLKVIDVVPKRGLNIVHHHIGVVRQSERRQVIKIQGVIDRQLRRHSLRLLYCLSKKKISCPVPVARRPLDRSHLHVVWFPALPHRLQAP